MDSDEAVDALSYEQITKLLKEIVRSVEANGSPDHVPGILNDWSLVAPFWDKDLTPSPVNLHVDVEASRVGETVVGVHEGRTITAKATKDEDGLIHWQSTCLQYEGIVTGFEWNHWRKKEGSRG